MDYEVFSGHQLGSQALDDTLKSAWQTISGLALPPSTHADVREYFVAVAGILATLRAAGDTRVADDVMRHVAYLADKAGTGADHILSGGLFHTEEQVVLDALANISAALSAVAHAGPRAKAPAIPAVAVADLAPILDVVVSGGTFLPGHQATLDALGDIGAVLRTALEKAPPAGVPAAVFEVIVQAETKLSGWCSRDKALLIARTVLKERPEICVEIGVFGGRSLFPCAAALRHNGAGVIYGIEAWSPNVAIENPTNQVNDEWWSKIDFGQIKHDFFRFATDMDLVRQVRLVESPSSRVPDIADRIDYLHIDGSHSVVNAAEDVLLYVPKVRRGGIVIFDDINWQSTGPARELLAAFCEPVTTLKDPETGLDICALLRRR